MSVLYVPSMEKGASTTVNVWKKLFQSSPHGSRSGSSIAAYAGNTATLWICVRPQGGTPSNPPVESDKMYPVYAGDTLNLGSLGDYVSDVYIGTADGSVQTYNAWEVIN